MTDTLTLHGVALTRRGDTWRGKVRGVDVFVWRGPRRAGHEVRAGWVMTVRIEPVAGGGDGVTVEAAFADALRDLLAKCREVEGVARGAAP